MEGETLSGNSSIGYLAHFVKCCKVFAAQTSEYNMYQIVAQKIKSPPFGGLQSVLYAELRIMSISLIA